MIMKIKWLVRIGKCTTLHDNEFAFYDNVLPCSSAWPSNDTYFSCCTASHYNGYSEHVGTPTFLSVPRHMTMVQVILNMSERWKPMIRARIVRRYSLIYCNNPKNWTTRPEPYITRSFAIERSVWSGSTLFYQLIQQFLDTWMRTKYPSVLGQTSLNKL